MKRYFSHPIWLIFVFYGCFVWLGEQVGERPRITPPATIDVTFPAAIQLFMAGGDRYLAANIAVMRAMMLAPKETDKSAPALARLHQDAALFNPAHEDNYYIAEATLPWAGQGVAANMVLWKAFSARPYDFYPAFLLGFNSMYFDKDFHRAGELYALAAGRMPDPQQKEALLALSARIYEKGDNPDVAIAVIKVMQQGARNPQLKEYFQLRIQRLELLKQLRSAEQEYIKRFGRSLTKLDELVSSGVLKELPEDPLGVGFEIRHGKPALRLRKQD